jgi:DNA invertase Pin-like site-specific DNA recombinase
MKNIFCDKMTGTTFERPQYEAMKIILEHICDVNASVEGAGEVVEVVFEELDRLGRNTAGIKKELEWYREHNICVRILEIPTTLIEVNEHNKWVMELINQILIEVYAAMAQQELEKRAKRQAEGIAVAKKKGVQFGRKRKEINEELFAAVYQKWKTGEITARQAMLEVDLKPNTFYRRVGEYESMVEKVCKLS